MLVFCKSEIDVFSLDFKSALNAFSGVSAFELVFKIFWGPTKKLRGIEWSGQNFFFATPYPGNAVFLNNVSAVRVKIFLIADSDSP